LALALSRDRSDVRLSPSSEAEIRHRTASGTLYVKRANHQL
jgi:hypothetical protein